MKRAPSRSGGHAGRTRSVTISNRMGWSDHKLTGQPRPEPSARPCWPSVVLPVLTHPDNTPLETRVIFLSRPSTAQAPSRPHRPHGRLCPQRRLQGRELLLTKSLSPPVGRLLLLLLLPTWSVPSSHLASPPPSPPAKGSGPSLCVPWPWTHEGAETAALGHLLSLSRPCFWVRPLHLAQINSCEAFSGLGPSSINR